MKAKPTPEELAQAYHAYTANLWSDGHFRALIRQDPGEAWQALTRLFDLATNDDHAAFIAAGPLQDFVVAHGQQFLEAICAHARTYPHFRQALGGVWAENQMPKKVWNQIQKLAHSA